MRAFRLEIVTMEAYSMPHLRRGEGSAAGQVSAVGETTRNGQSILANRSQADAIASCRASSCRCRGTGIGARSFQYGAEARSASVQQ